MFLTQSSRRDAFLLLSLLLVCARAPGQTPAQSSAGSPVQGAVRPDPKRAQKAAEQGDKAEAAGRTDDALIAYDEAARFAPQDMSIVGRGAALRSQLVRSHVDAAERLALAGNAAQAAEELHGAMRIDPSNTVVAERIAQMEAMKDDDQPAPRPEQISGLPRLKTQEGKHSFDLRGDTKSAYGQVTQAFGIKAAFDPDLPTRSVRLRVADIDFNTALSVLGEQTGTFWRP